MFLISGVATPLLSPTLSTPASRFELHNNNVKYVIKYTSIKLYNPDIYNQSMCIVHETNL